MHKTHPHNYEDLRDTLLKAISFPKERLPFLIAIDGRDGAGKSSLASWLAWQLGMPTIHLDLLLEENRLAWRTDDLSRLLATRLAKGGPLIVEGILVLDALEKAGRLPDYLVFVENETGGYSNKLDRDITGYCCKRGLPSKADYKLTWSEPPGQTMEEAEAELDARFKARGSDRAPVS